MIYATWSIGTGKQSLPVAPGGIDGGGGGV